jgi:hypothetical protein
MDVLSRWRLPWTPSSSFSSLQSFLQLEGEWLECYKTFNFEERSGPDPCIRTMFSMLSQKGFPEVPKDIYFDIDRSSLIKVRKYFSIMWKKFFVVIDITPLDGSLLKFLVTVSSTGLIIEYDTVEKVVKHLVGNRKFYCNEIAI